MVKGLLAWVTLASLFLLIILLLLISHLVHKYKTSKPISTADLGHFCMRQVLVIQPDTEICLGLKISPPPYIRTSKDVQQGISE